MKSSYVENNFDLLFKSLSFAMAPSLIVEFGILEGYSLRCFLETSNEECQVIAYDLFDDFPYNHADYNDIRSRFSMYSDRLVLKKKSFYESVADFQDESIDILHIDIANNGDVYKFAVENYLPKLRTGGIVLLEGGSHERDHISWMIEYNKPSIIGYLDSIKDEYEFKVIEDFPSITIFRK